MERVNLACDTATECTQLLVDAFARGESLVRLEIDEHSADEINETTAMAWATAGVEAQRVHAADHLYGAAPAWLTDLRGLMDVGRVTPSICPARYGFTATHRPWVYLILEYMTGEALRTLTTTPAMGLSPRARPVYLAHEMAMVFWPSMARGFAGWRQQIEGMGRRMLHHAPAWQSSARLPCPTVPAPAGAATIASMLTGGFGRGLPARGAPSKRWLPPLGHGGPRFP